MKNNSSVFGQNYAYGYGRVGVLQQYLFSTSDIERMLDARDEKHLMEILSELRFTNQILGDISQDKELIPAMERWLKKEVEGMVPDYQKDIFGILWLRNDAAQLAHLLKQFLSLTSSLSIIPDPGVTEYDPEDLRSLVLNGMPGSLPRELTSFVSDIKDRRNIGPQEIDGEVGKFVARMQRTYAEHSGSHIIDEYVRHMIDLQNIRTASRLRPGDDSNVHLLPGGDINPFMLVSDSQHLASQIRKRTLLSADVSEGMTGLTDDSSIALERGLATAIAHNVARMRAVPLGIEPIFAFALIALSQIKILRTIIIGKSVGLSADEIRDMLPPFLSAAPFES
jgi:V/A-type H+-transporting ATPase subunit C